MKIFFNQYRKTNTKVFRIVGYMSLVIVIFCLNACDSYTETDMPVSELNAAAVFEEKNTANAAMTDIYAQIRDNGLLTGKVTGISKNIGLYSDELTWYGSNSLSSQNFYNNTVLPSTVDVSNWWNSAYSQIYAANAVIEGVASSTKLAQVDKDQLTGEAKFVRGLLHFYLLQLYGDIPYITTTDYKVNIGVSRMPSAEVYSHSIEDITAASELLPEAYPTGGRVRPNSYAAKALLARIYLYNGAWAEAADNASAVLNNTESYIWQNDLSKIFLKESTTAIWQLMPRTATRNTDEGATFIFSFGPPPQTALSEGLINAFENGDLRKTNWIKGVTDGTTTWYHAYKYKKSRTSNPAQEYPIVLRLAEQYLIRAEARAQQGELIGAKEDLNKIRNTAGLGDTEAVTKAEILDAILQERRVEFFTEYGHRFFDLKRTGKLDEFLSGTKPDWNNTDRLLPIPQSEINLNPNIAPQNPGY